MVVCKRFRGSHTAENIHEMFEETIDPYDLTQKMRAIVTDNAANMLKVFSLTGMEILGEAQREKWRQEKTKQADGMHWRTKQAQK